MIDKKYFLKFNGNQGVSKEFIQNFNLPKNIPFDYFEFLQLYDGGEGFIGEEYIIFYKVEELMQINNSYEVEKYLPGVFLIGSNGGSEAIAIDLRKNNSKYILISFLFEEGSIVELGRAMSDFLNRIFKKGFFD